jgi:pimeloyl-ACP methyl ester carboxylesterase
VSSSSIEVQVAGGFAANEVICGGDGPPLVYLHGPFGPDPWEGYLADLARTHRVFAPAHPGGRDPADLERLDNVADLLLYYDDLLDAMGLDEVVLVGHSFGGMVAAEFAATFRPRLRKLVLIDPLGLWRDEAPVTDYVLIPPDEQASLLFRDHESPTAQEAFLAPLNFAGGPDAAVRRMMNIASTSHFVWPIPERGLVKRLRRITAPTLIVWGRQDAVADVSYAQDFANGISNAVVRVVDNAGHYAHVEQREQVSAATLEFLGA